MHWGLPVQPVFVLFFHKATSPFFVILFKDPNILKFV